MNAQHALVQKTGQFPGTDIVRRLTRGGHMPPVRLHLGAHKTASTHLQAALAGAQGELWARGIAYAGPDEIRGGGTGLHEAITGLSPMRARWMLWRRYAGCRRIIASEENLIGTMEDNFLGPGRGQGIYHRAAQRLERLICRLGLGEVEVFLCVRLPTSYVSSCYRYHIQKKEFITWSSYSSGQILRDVSWIRLVRDLRRVPGVAGVTVWRYEDYPLVAPQVLDALLGEDRPNIPTEGQPLNIGLSAQQVRKCYATAGVTPDFGGKGFRPFGTKAIVRASQRYRRELARMERMPGITVLRP